MAIHHPRQTMRPASFRGVPFEVDTDQATGFGRHVVVHEYVNAEDHATEDLGRRAGRIKLTAYLPDARFGADAYARRDALVAACTAKGPAMLVLPSGRPRQVRCISIDTSDDRNKQGYVRAELEFVDVGAALGPVGLPIGNRILQSLLQGLPAALGAAVVERADWTLAQRDQLSITAVNGVALVETVRAGVPLDVEAATEIFTTLQDLTTAIASLSGAEATGAWIEAVADAAAAISDAAEPLDLAPAWRDALAAAPAIHPATKSPALSRAIAPQQRGAVAIEALALCEYARAQANREYRDRQTAIDARTALRAVAEPALQRIGASLGEEPHAIAAQAVSLACAHIAAIALDLKPIVVVETARTIPSTLAAWAMYGDPARAEDLVRRNRIATPLLMPRAFEALAV